MKYKVGDIVLVAKIDYKSSRGWTKYEGKIGKIVNIWNKTNIVKFDYNDINFKGEELFSFRKEELVPATEAAKILYGVK